jgi:diaminohydroxyphosphoribosylaminopyrimidine deaminase / 5-amino-6-(5-phosphoribosylamino)uracil reductase
VSTAPFSSDVAWALLLALCRYPRCASPASPVIIRWNLESAHAIVDAPEHHDATRSAASSATACLSSTGQGPLEVQGRFDAAALELIELYGPLAHPGRSPFVIAHLGQSLDGRIGPPDGAPECITGPRDHEHNHRLRALCDVVLVGAGTVFHDDPRLNVRLCSGPDPLRVVLDPQGRLGPEYRVFQEQDPSTLLIVGASPGNASPPRQRHGFASVLVLADGCEPALVVQALAARGYQRIFVEGGGVTVSRFLHARVLHRLHITVAPLILGSGKAGLELPRVLRLRPVCRRLSLGEDVLFDCDLTASESPTELA